MTLDVVKQISILTPLTSSKVTFSPEQKHREAFEHVKTLLTKEPFFGNLIDKKKLRNTYGLMPLPAAVH
jgi:hypothetical protein